MFPPVVLGLGVVILKADRQTMKSIYEQVKLNVEIVAARVLGAVLWLKQSMVQMEHQNPCGKTMNNQIKPPHNHINST